MDQELRPRQERLKRREKAKKTRRKIFTIFAIIVAIFVLIWTLSTIFRLISLHRMDLVTVRHDVLEETVKKESVVIRKETVRTVPKSASVKYLVEENSRVSVGAPLLKVPSAEVNRTPGDSNHTIYASVAGTVSKECDGLESVLTPATLETLDLESVYDKVINGTFQGKEEQEGQAAIKIVDNLSPVYICFPRKDVSLEEGGSVHLRVSGSQEILSGTVAKIAGSIAVAKVAPVPNEMIGVRICDIEVVNRRAKGMVVPASALIEEEGTSGVYAVIAGEIQFAEVEIVGVFETQAVVKGLNLGQEVVSNP